MAGISRKLKREEGFHARIFTTKELAEMYIKRMKNKMGTGYVFGIAPWSDEGHTGFVAYMHKEVE
ncbi:MAG: hypothetical protein Tp1109DCM542121_3 [Prokaryotic dsDNA virus sp.]|nr:MAG: hypothetical protein Tp1109DCM542121_3 [Prokaryotic dsDNA virus sp.]|tara:strand:- start:736 stop:930 length:195 start_codon:yes stop_codon:yes gene_type:complete